jgi:hypothetical protein
MINMAATCDEHDGPIFLLKQKCNLSALESGAEGSKQEGPIFLGLIVAILG